MPSRELSPRCDYRLACLAGSGRSDTFKIEIWPDLDVDTENGNPGRAKHMMRGMLGGGNIKIHN